MDFNEKVLSHSQELILQVQTSVRIRSVCSDPLPGRPYGSEVGKAYDHAMNLAESMGFRTVDLDGYVGYAEYGTGPEIVAAMGHLDVVPEGDGWDFDPFCGEIRDEHILGRGTQDDKGPAMSTLFALKALAELEVPVRRRIRIIFGLDEEGGHMRDVDTYLEREGAPVMAFTPDGEYPLVHAEKGALKFRATKNFTNENSRRIVRISGGESLGSVPVHAEAHLTGTEVELDRFGADLEAFSARQGWKISLDREANRLILHVFGKAAHATMPGLGINAIGRLCQCLAQLDVPGDEGAFFRFLSEKIGTESDGQSLGLAAEHPKLGNLTLNLATIEGDGSQTTFQVGIYVPAKTLEVDAVLDRIDSLFQGAGIEMDVMNNIAPLYVPPRHPVVRNLQRAYLTATGNKPQLLGMCGSTYSKRMPNMIPFGATFPGEPDFAHAAGEKVAIFRLIKSTQIMAHGLWELAR